jgi:hypothetical protein
VGRSFESYALRKSALEPVRSAVEGWLTERGLVPGRSHVSDALHSDDYSRVVIFHNDEWTIILHNQPFQPVDSVESVLTDLDAPLLKTWVYDSDLWGYELRVDGQLRASYNSNPKYFGVATDQPLPKNGDPDELAAALGMPELAKKIAEAQGGKSVFAEFRAEKFASALGALPLIFETELVPPYLRTDPKLTAGGYQVVVLDYAKPRTQMRLVDLHLDYTGAGGRFTAADIPTLDPDTMRQIEQTQRFFRAVGFVFKPVFWVAGLVIRPLVKAAAMGAMSDIGRGKTGEEFTRLLKELRALAVPGMRQEGPWVVNPHYGYRVRGRMVPGAEELPAPGSVFCLQLLEGTVNCTIMPPEQVRMLLSHAVARSGEDVKHFVGDYQARTMWNTMPPPMKLTTVQTLLRLDDALLMFGGSFKDIDPAVLRRAWEEMINSFEVRPR